MFYCTSFAVRDRLVGLVAKASASRTAFLGSIPAFVVDLFPCQVTPETYKFAVQWLPCLTPGAIGSALGLVGPVSVYCDWVRQKV